MIRHAAASAVLTAILAAGASADAATIIRSASISASGPIATALVGFPEFDPAVGSLDSIGIEISGTLAVDAVLPPSQTILPVVAFDASGAGGRGFDFAGDGASFRFTSVTNASATASLPVTLFTSFTMSFLVDGFSDLAGVIVPATSSTSASLVPPTTVAAQRSDFIQGVAPIGISETLVFTPSGFVATNITVGGAVIVTYTYTPAALPPSIPAPGAVALLAALPLLLLHRRRRPAMERASRRD